MAATVPAVVPTGNPTMNRLQDQGTQSSMSLGGGPQAANNYILDGLSITDLSNRPVMAPSIESLQEVKVQVNTYDAEMGRTGGGVFNATGKSGTNDWHGSAFTQHRPKWGTANDFFGNRAGLPVPDVSYLSYGGSFGGPVLRNRTFAWATTEGMRLQSTRTGVITVPTELQRRGDFSQTFDAQGRLVVIYDPLTTRPNPNGTGFIRDPFPGNVIPAERMSTVGRNLMGFFPAPDAGRGGVDGRDNYIRSGVLEDRGDQQTVKVDHRFNDDYTFSAMYGHQMTHEPAGKFYEGLVSDPAAGALDRPVHVLAINNVIIPSPTSVISLRVGYTRFGDFPVSSSVGFDVGGLGFPSALVGQMTLQKFPRIVAEGLGELVPQDQTGGAVLGDSGPADRVYYTQVASGSYAKFIGRHNLKFGADYRQLSVDILDYGQASGQYSFTKAFTQGPNPLTSTSNAGNAVASMLLGYPVSGTIPIPTPYNAFTRYYGAYVQDDFRVTSNLTLNLGLRYEFEAGLREEQDRMVVGFDRDAVSPLNGRVPGLNLTGGLMYAGLNGAPDHQGDPSSRKFSPRVGFAWTLGPNVLRGGYGIFYVPGPYANNATVGARGFTGISTYFASSDGGLTPAGSIDNPFPGGLDQPVGSSQGALTGVGTSVSFPDQFAKSGYVHQYSVDLQRELPGSLAVSIGYIGSRSEQLTVGGTVNINQLPTELLSLGPALQQAVPNPFLGIPEMGALGRSATVARGQLLRPYPQFLDVLASNVSEGFSRYHAVVLKAERRLSGGIAARASYTWSNRKDNQFGIDNYYARQAGDRIALNNYDLEREYATSVLDSPHWLILTGTYQLPWGEGRKWLNRSGVTDWLLGGWQLTGVGTYRSGFPTPIAQNNNNSGTFGGGQRPNVVPGADPQTDGSTIERLDNWFNTAAFSEAAPFTLGNSSRTTSVRTPFFKNWDVSLEKWVHVGGVRGILRIEGINALNWPNFRGADTRFGRVTFGRITQMTGFARQVQVTYRVQF
jgi:hypothetical protein